MNTKFAPLPGSFMIVALFGFLFAVFFLKDYSLPWTFVVATFSIIMFAASLLSMTFAPVEDELLMDDPVRRKQETEIISAAEALKRQHGEKPRKKK